FKSLSAHRGVRGGVPTESVGRHSSFHVGPGGDPLEPPLWGLRPHAPCRLLSAITYWSPSLDVLGLRPLPPPRLATARQLGYIPGHAPPRAPPAGMGLRPSPPPRLASARRCRFTQPEACLRAPPAGMGLRPLPPPRLASARRCRFTQPEACLRAPPAGMGLR